MGVFAKIALAEYDAVFQVQFLTRTLDGDRRVSQYRLDDCMYMVGSFAYNGGMMNGNRTEHSVVLGASPLASSSAYLSWVSIICVSDHGGNGVFRSAYRARRTCVQHNQLHSLSF